MLKRSATAVGLLLLGFPALVLGGLPYFLFIGFLLCASAWEYSEMFRAAGARPARWLVLLGVAALLAARFYYPQASNLVFSVGILAMLTWHLVDYESGTERAGLDFGVSVGALAYLGWIGAYLLDMRHLDQGAWWLMFVLPCVWLADVGAYMIGAAYGIAVINTGVAGVATENSDATADHAHEDGFTRLKTRDLFMPGAIVSAAVVLQMDGDVCRSARIVLGGVAPIPWRVPEVERLLQGQRITLELAARAGDASVAGARPLGGNGYKVPMTRSLVARAVNELARQA